jgi:tRNA pseudouridine38-40 synthase
MGGIIPDHYCIIVRGSGFLKQMVRLMVGAIWEVGKGKLELEELKLSLKEASGRHVCAVAAPNGLIKFAVEY